ncbi:MAG: hypothetical protein ACRD4S_01995 [Candidatus Acidiferrales bacterium]
MVLAIAALFLQFQPALPISPAPAAVKSTQLASAAPALAVTNLTSDAPVFAPDGVASRTPSAPASLANESNTQSFATVHIPPVRPSKDNGIEWTESRPSRRSWLALAVAEHSAAAFDAYSTRQAISRGAVEDDPLMQPFAHSPMIYAATQVGPLMFDYLSRRMQRSEYGFVRRMWWAPQSLSMGVSIFAGVHNLHVANIQSMQSRQR